ncbi:Protein kinase-like domain containing protein [Trema orientale]|uniref:Protein kinase-like domain containing protein n=1 Tax=Trema orientale TaxID=63057 RepID=A0A2P5ET16_TREOI|nr:Protein kinase-like domain containing protein [Trema orientale]
MSPEYAMGGIFSEKSDVFLLEMGLDLLDQALADSSSCSLEVMRCIPVGLLCVQDHATDRPTMPDAVSMLNNETNRPQPKQPIFTFQSSSRSRSSTSK